MPKSNACKKGARTGGVGWRGVGGEGGAHGHFSLDGEGNEAVVVLDISLQDV